MSEVRAASALLLSPLDCSRWVTVVSDTPPPEVPPDPSARARPRLFYGWVIVGAAALSSFGQVTFFNDLFKQFSNTGAAGFPFFTGPDPGVEVDTQGDSPTIPDQQVTLFADIFQCFEATTAGGSAIWTGEVCP